MIAVEVISEIRRRGATLRGDEEGRLRVRPASILTPELVEEIRQNKAAILERLEGGEEPIIRDTGEVLELARAHFGELAPEMLQEAPYPPPEPGTDPMVHKHTDKARFFQGERRRDQERREREGLPPWIRLVDGGGDAA